MGYVNNSPTKKIWIPLESGWLQEYADGSTLSEFNKEYKKRYGIDLTEIVKLDDERIYIAGDVSTYLIPDGTYKVPMVNNFPWELLYGYEAGSQDAITRLLICDFKGNSGFGMEFTIHKSATLSYENIVVGYVEI